MQVEISLNVCNECATEGLYIFFTNDYEASNLSIRSMGKVHLILDTQTICMILLLDCIVFWT